MYEAITESAKLFWMFTVVISVFSLSCGIIVGMAMVPDRKENTESVGISG